MKKKHSVLGQQEGKSVTDWLAANQKRDAVRKLVELEMRRSLEDTRAEIIELVHSTVRRWRLGSFPVATSSDGGWTVIYKDDWNRRIPWKQIRAFSAALRLAAWGLLNRVRRCARAECGTWFFAKIPTQRFHSGKCHHIANTHDEERKRQRAAYMREHRRIQKLERRVA